MMSGAESPDFPDYLDKTAEVWNRIAEWWDDKIGDGNDFQDMIEPVTENMLALKPGEQVLDIGCGGGRFARRMASRGANVVAIDHAEKFLERARQRSKTEDRGIEYLHVNAGDEVELLSLGEGRFDAAVCTMALMDMATIEPLMNALARLLKPSSRFVFSVTHPVFNSGNARRIAEEQELDGNVINRFGAVITDYSNRYMHMGIGIIGQPEPHYYFHRPINMLFNTCFKRGLFLDWIEELTFSKDPAATQRGPLDWANFHSIPHSLVARMRNLPGMCGRGS